MEKKDVIAFFDRCAPAWDAEMIKSDRIIGQILDNAEVHADLDVLDVACGTGVLFDYYLDRGVRSVTGIDISPAMAKIASEKYAGESRIRVIRGDVEAYPFDRKFDRIVVYNAFPHFPDPVKLIGILAGLLKAGGRLTIAHGQSREAINNHHSGPASKVSNGLMAAEDLKQLFDDRFDVEVMISNRHMYQLSGVRKDDAPASAAAARSAPPEELLAMLKYLISHNKAHSREIADLARDLQTAGKEKAYREIMDAVAGFDLVNAKLAAVLGKLTAGDF